MFKFLLTPLREGRLYGRKLQGDRVYFYSRPCGRGDGKFIIKAKTESLFLLTPLREGRPMYSAGLAEALPISTHAPAGGATRYPPHIGRRERISTHAPAGGATS